MKKLIIFPLLFVAVFASAQIEVTKFLGIPVDGNKQQMIQKIKEKGYLYNSNYDRLEGEFNGRDVFIYVVTNNNKVYRILVEDAVYSSEGDIKIRFNTLLRQFENNNQKYFSMSTEDGELSESEDISYEMTVNNKRYEAAFIQTNNTLDSVTLSKKMEEFNKENYGDDYLLDMTDEQILDASIKFFLSLYIDNSVWFMINERYGRYGILLYYDNNRNRANGEEL
ncbi:MAG: hypothetical protein SOT07_01800 [Paludibacteraceae bacterium]|nr:hypothetical protein [Paludibacteraceae bacterium]